MKKAWWDAMAMLGAGAQARREELTRDGTVAHRQVLTYGMVSPARFSKLIKSTKYVKRWCGCGARRSQRARRQASLFTTAPVRSQVSAWSRWMGTGRIMEL